jgi:hypothetical protein
MKLQVCHRVSLRRWYGLDQDPIQSKYVFLTAPLKLSMGMNHAQLVLQSPEVLSCKSFGKQVRYLL